MSLDSLLFVRPTTASVDVNTASTVDIKPPLSLNNSGRRAAESVRQTGALAVVQINGSTPSNTKLSNFILEESLVNTDVNLSGNRVVYTPENTLVAIAKVNASSNNSTYSPLIARRTTVPVYQSSITYGIQNNLLYTRFNPTRVFRINVAETTVPFVVAVNTDRNQNIINTKFMTRTVVQVVRTTNWNLSGSGSGGTGGGGTGGGGSGGTGGPTAFWS
jgi:uncharacterized membrane protein YgcG